MVDLILTIAELAVFPFALAAIGGYLAAKVLTDRGERNRFIAVFAILFVLGVLVSAIRETRASRLDENRTQTITNMYGQIQILVGTVTHPPANQEHQELASSLRAMAEKLKVPKVAAPSKVPPVLLTPEQSLHIMTTKDLREYAINLANGMREFESNYITTQVNKELARPRIDTSDPNQQRQVWAQQVQESITAHALHENEFRKRFWGDARALRDELIDRFKKKGLSPPAATPAYMQGEANMVLDEGALAGAYPITAASNYLEVLARALP